MPDASNAKADASAAYLWDVLDAYVEAADWYRRCLEDVVDRRPVRGLAEAKAAYDSTYRQAIKTLEADSHA